MNDTRLRGIKTRVAKLVTWAPGEYGKAWDAFVDSRRDNIVLLAEVERLREENAQIRKHFRRPTHGPCCTCQRCGQNYDDCRCDLDDAGEEIAQLRAALAAKDSEATGKE